ncbi:MAG TPA: ABC transporter permease, partial [Terriglobia bacterium]|nr:ABC transporter permease [Terriglobia bacterium]
MISFAFRRALAALPMLVGVSFVSFLLLHLLPGDPARAILGQRATEENVRQFRAHEGLDDPLLAQYGRFLSRMAKGDLGRSHRTNRPVAEEIGERLPATIELAVAAMLLAGVVGISLGTLAAIRPRGLMDFVCLALALVGVSMPIFWLGFLAQKTFAGGLGLLPFGARLDVAAWPTFEAVTGFYLIDAAFVYRNLELTWDVLRHLALPAAVLATVPMALIARMTRANMIEALGKDYIRTARAKGIPRGRVIVGHAIPNALIPIVTAIGAQFGYLLGGAVLTETIFGWPGIGVYVIDSINVLDAQPLQAAVMLVGAFFIVINLVTDLSYAAIDPRLRGGAGSIAMEPGAGWRECALWIAASLPWVGLVAAAVWRRSGREAPWSEATTGVLWWGALVAVAVEIVVVAGIGIRNGLWGNPFAGQRRPVGLIRSAFSPLIEFGRFVV